MRNKVEEYDMRAIAEELGVAPAEVKRAVMSFFGEISGYSRSLPFNNRQRIYSKQKFEEFVSVWNIPGIGRIGPVYSRYLKWRENESRSIIQEQRSNYRNRISQDDIEHMADEVLSGRTPSPLRKKKGNEMYNRVWLVGTDGKRLARQVIPKEQD